MVTMHTMLWTYRLWRCHFLSQVKPPLSCSEMADLRPQILEPYNQEAVTGFEGKSLILGVAQIAFFFIAAVVIMAITVVAGIGDGVMLFAAMAIIIDYALLIPLFGAVQSDGASARMWIFRKHIHWNILGLFLLAFVLCAILGTFVWDN